MNELTKTQAAAVAVQGYDVEFAIAAWLDSKDTLSHSQKTRTAYENTIADYRFALQKAGLDLDFAPHAQREAAAIAQAYAKSSKRGKAVASATINQRLAILSSFFAFTSKRDLLPDGNPIERIERAKIQSYAHAAPLDAGEIRSRLGAIDRSTLQGKRDYAILVLALSTGRRLGEIAALRLGDVAISGAKVIVTFVTKGGKTIRDALQPSVASALLEYLQSQHGSDALASLPGDTPLWLSESKRNHGAGIGWQTIRKICETRLGVTKFHALRHTFAHAMSEAGAKPTTIQQRLGHSSLSTTSIYLDALASDDNPSVDAVCEMLGIE